VESVVAQLRRHGVVDDEAFAAYWVEQRQTFRPRGARLVRAELTRLGVARVAADEATTPLEDSAEEDAYRAAARRAHQLRTLDQRTFQVRLGQWLARRGFDWDTVSAVVERLWTDTAAEPG
jgi:regulatory protein